MAALGFIYPYLIGPLHIAQCMYMYIHTCIGSGFLDSRQPITYLKIDSWCQHADLFVFDYSNIYNSRAALVLTLRCFFRPQVNLRLSLLKMSFGWFVCILDCLCVFGFFLCFFWIVYVSFGLFVCIMVCSCVIWFVHVSFGLFMCLLDCLRVLWIV